eukprot:GABV01007189.1.p1 GENE.GABV01007189.1~~GABV01007189.1.p1  ORF type:complete len:101 (+),score=25.79 GABV01007189.1:70-372(+)
MTDAASFIIRKEDHTLGNLVRMKLLRDERVIFAGYKVPHPLKYDLIIKLRTTKDHNPVDVMKENLEDIQGQLSKFQSKFGEAMRQWEMESAHIVQSHSGW